VADDTEVTISGLTITGGFTYESGGGIYSEADSLTLDGVVVEDNYSLEGGGVFHSYGDIEIRDSEIRLNGSMGAGAAGVAIRGASSALMRPVPIADNTSPMGGLEIYNTDLCILNSTISSNTASDCDGGGIYLYGDYGMNAEIINSTMPTTTLVTTAAAFTLPT